jgi:xanthine dehydrogenase accessory factor
MAVAATGEVVGSISGGCIEGYVYELARGVIASGEPRSETFGIEDDDAFNVGLTCGGTIEVFIELINSTTFPEFSRVAEALEKGEQFSVATVLAGPAKIGSHLIVGMDYLDGSLHSTGLDLGVESQARGLLEAGGTNKVRLGENGERHLNDVVVFVTSFSPPPKMFVFGAIDFAAAVVRIGKFLGYHVTLCDARPTFATPRRFPDADEIAVEWPHKFLSHTSVDERSVICVLTHDPKFDVPLLKAALLTEARYIGAMGSRRTHEDRMARLRACGVTEESLNRLSSPIGLDLRGRTPEETAVSIAAEIIASGWGGSGRRLSSISSSIHEPQAAPVRA